MAESMVEDRRRGQILPVLTVYPIAWRWTAAAIFGGLTAWGRPYGAFPDMSRGLLGNEGASARGAMARTPRHQVVDTGEQHRWPMRRGRTDVSHRIVKTICPKRLRRWSSSVQTLAKRRLGRPSVLPTGVNHFVARVDGPGPRSAFGAEDGSTGLRDVTVAARTRVCAARAFVIAGRPLQRASAPYSGS